MAWLLVASGRYSKLVRPFLARVRNGLTPAQLAAAQEVARGFGGIGAPGLGGAAGGDP